MRAVAVIIEIFLCVLQYFLERGSVYSAGYLVLTACGMDNIYPFTIVLTIYLKKENGARESGLRLYKVLFMNF